MIPFWNYSGWLGGWVAGWVAGKELIIRLTQSSWAGARTELGNRVKIHKIASKQTVPRKFRLLFYIINM